MARVKELKFKPYIGRFFEFEDSIKKNPRQAILGRAVYGNSIEKRKRFKTTDELPSCFFVVDEKRNHVRLFLEEDGSFWVPKTQIQPLDLPTYDGNPVPLLNQIRQFLVFCTETKIKDFKVEEMTSWAMDLIPKIDAMIQKNTMEIIPK